VAKRKARSEEAWCAWCPGWGWLWYTVSSIKETAKREMEENRQNGKVLRVRITEIIPKSKKGKKPCRRSK